MAQHAPAITGYALYWQLFRPPSKIAELTRTERAQAAQEGRIPRKIHPLSRPECQIFRSSADADVEHAELIKAFGSRVVVSIKPLLKVGPSVQLDLFDGLPTQLDPNPPPRRKRRW
jgi:hypothetical protein